MAGTLPATGVTRRALLGGAVAGIALARPAILRAQDADIRIGFPVPLTGPYGAEAQDQVRCAQLAIAEFNAAGGLNGRHATLLSRDDKLKPGEAATRTLELLEKDKAHAIVGSLSASVQLAVNNITKQRKVLYNSISQSDQIVAMPDWSRYTFHEAMTPHQTAGAVGRYAFPKFGKKVAFISADYAYGHETVAGFRAAGEKFGIEVVADIRVPLGTTDFSTLMPRIAALKPDILCLCNFGRDQQISIRQATDFGLKRRMKIIVPVLLYTARIAGGAQAFEGVVGGTSYYWGIEQTVPSAKAFNDRYRAANGGRVPSDYGALGYSGVRAVLTAMKQAGTTDTEKVIDVLQSLHYDFYKGAQWYRPCDHQSVQSVFIIQSKRKGANKYDVFDVVATDPANEDALMSCKAEGHV
ncbi:MAG: ABC transporter substrate-binding protein [Rhodospirillales bacterium]|nr:ABC transporter substrate-binding protein [Rhodospirillales bacterium]